MSKIKLWITIATLLLLVGIVGSVYTFPTIIKNNAVSIKDEFHTSVEMNNINVKTTNSKVQFKPTTEDTLKVTLESSNSNEELTTLVEDSTLTINVKNKSWHFFSMEFFSDIPILIIHLPEHEYESIKIKSDNGTIVMADIAVEKLNAKTSNGTIELSEIDANITDFKTSNGKVILTNIKGDISGKTSNGSITYNAENILQAIDLHTSNGKIKINTETELTNNTLDLRTDFGKIRVFDSPDWDTNFGNGDYLIKLRTDNGGITIKHQ